MRIFRPPPFLLPSAFCLLLTVGTGCDAFQRKFTRKPKHSAPPSPIISFQDYTRTMTPLDRYRKHYMMFDYWDTTLIESLQSRSPNPKRFKRASTESLAELKIMSDLIGQELATRLLPLVEARAQLDRQLQQDAFNAAQAQVTIRTLEAQTRQIRREFFWRDVEDHLKQSSMDSEGGTPSSPQVP